MNTQPITSAPSKCDQRFAKSIVLSSWWNQACDRFMTMLLQRQTPIATEKRDSNGSFWQIYDPNTGRSVYVRSQREAILWLEQRHSQFPKTSFNQPRH